MKKMKNGMLMIILCGHAGLIQGMTTLPEKAVRLRGLQRLPSKQPMRPISIPQPVKPILINMEELAQGSQTNDSGTQLSSAEIQLKKEYSTSLPKPKEQYTPAGQRLVDLWNSFWYGNKTVNELVKSRSSTAQGATSPFNTGGRRPYSSSSTGRSSNQGQENSWGGWFSSLLFGSKEAKPEETGKQQQQQEAQGQQQEEVQQQRQQEEQQKQQKQQKQQGWRQYLKDEQLVLVRDAAKENTSFAQFERLLDDVEKVILNRIQIALKQLSETEQLQIFRNEATVESAIKDFDFHSLMGNKDELLVCYAAMLKSWSAIVKAEGKKLKYGYQGTLIDLVTKIFEAFKVIGISQDSIKEYSYFADPDTKEAFENINDSYNSRMQNIEELRQKWQQEYYEKESKKRQERKRYQQQSQLSWRKHLKNEQHIPAFAQFERLLDDVEKVILNRIQINLYYEQLSKAEISQIFRNEFDVERAIKKFDFHSLMNYKEEILAYYAAMLKSWVIMVKAEGKQLTYQSQWQLVDLVTKIFEAFKVIGISQDSIKEYSYFADPDIKEAFENINDSYNERMQRQEEYRQKTQQEEQQKQQQQQQQENQQRKQEEQGQQEEEQQKQKQQQQQAEPQNKQQQEYYEKESKQQQQRKQEQQKQQSKNQYEQRFQEEEARKKREREQEEQRKQDELKNTSLSTLQFLMNATRKDYTDLLEQYGIKAAGALSDEELKKMRLKIMMQVHPDIKGDVVKAQELNEAWSEYTRAKEKYKAKQQQEQQEKNNRS